MSSQQKRFDRIYRPELEEQQPAKPKSQKPKNALEKFGVGIIRGKPPGATGRDG